MTAFVEALLDSPFLQRALLVGLLAAVCSGVVGAYVVARRITYLAGSIAHCVLGGLGAARYLQINHNIAWLDPMIGAVVAAVGAAVIIALASLYGREREDTVIGAVWAIGMAIGLLFLHLTDGYPEDLGNFLFGNILLVSTPDIWRIVVLDVVVVLLGVVLYRPIAAVCFDPAFARSRGLNVEGYTLLLLVMTALTIVVLVKLVGVILVIALLTLPVAIAGCFARTLLGVMLLATVLSMTFSTAGLAISYSPELPSGVVIVLVNGVAYMLVMGARALGIGRRNTTRHLSGPSDRTADTSSLS